MTELSASIRTAGLAAMLLAGALAPGAAAAGAEVFRDDFDGGELGGHWSLANPDPSGFIVEDGQLIVIAGAKGDLSDPEKANIFLLDLPVPDGDWEIEVVYDAEFNTRHEILQFGLYDDAENFLAASSSLGGRFKYNCALLVGMDDMSRGQLKANSTSLADWEGCQGKVVDFMQRKGTGPRPYKLVLRKTGRSYAATHQFGDELPEDQEPRIVETGAVATLRPPKRIALAVGQKAEPQGETLFKIDRIVIRESD